MTKGVVLTLKLIAIKTKDKVFISDAENDTYYKKDLTRYIFDGEKPKEANIKKWYEISKVPTKITEVISGAIINQRYELKKGYPVSELTPQIIGYYDNDEYEEVMGLYEYKYDRKPEYESEVKFEISVIEEQDGFKLIKEDFKVSHQFIDRLKFNEVQLPFRPCKMTTEETYKIIREYVKTHIDGRYASIKSDYDFHFEVMKKVQLYEPNFYEVDVNNNLFGRKRKPKYETRRQDNRAFTILNIRRNNSDKNYGDNCLVPDPFRGETYEDMVNNINTYLENLIKEINKPLEDCPCCKGTGIKIKEEIKDEV